MITKKIFAILMASMVSATVWADDDKKYDMDNGVIPIADDRGFTLQSNNGNFVFKPYLFLQSTLSYRYYDDEGLDLLERLTITYVLMQLPLVVISSSRPGSTTPPCRNCASVWVSSRHRLHMPI